MIDIRFAITATKVVEISLIEHKSCTISTQITRHRNQRTRCSVTKFAENAFSRGLDKRCLHTRDHLQMSQPSNGHALLSPTTRINESSPQKRIEGRVVAQSSPNIPKTRTKYLGSLRGLARHQLFPNIALTTTTILSLSILLVLLTNLLHLTLAHISKVDRHCQSFYGPRTL
jgi:hypothetical protein